MQGPKGVGLNDLHNTLMEQLNRLMDAETNEELEVEQARAKAVSSIAKEIVNNTANIIEANKIALEYGYKPVDNSLLIEDK